jgi:hypothetical protein
MALVRVLFSPDSRASIGPTSTTSIGMPSICEGRREALAQALAGNFPGYEHGNHRLIAGFSLTRSRPFGNAHHVWISAQPCFVLGADCSAAPDFRVEARRHYSGAGTAEEVQPAPLEPLARRDLFRCPARSKGAFHGSFPVLRQ